MFQALQGIAFDTGYAGSAGLQLQEYSIAGPGYIAYGSGGQNSGHDFFGTVSFSLLVPLSVLAPLCLREHTRGGTAL